MAIRLRRANYGHWDTVLVFGAMRTGIIGLPEVGKTTVFRILTRVHLDARTAHGAHVGVAHVADARLDKLAAIYHPRKVTYAAIEYLDIGGLVNDRTRDAAYLVQLREMDALAHVVRLFDNPAVAPPGGRVDAARDIESVEIELMLNDLEQMTRRLERIQKDLLRKKDLQLEHERAALARCRAALEAEKPLREVEFHADEQKIISGFRFLTQKPMLIVLNLDDSEAPELERAVEKHNLAAVAAKPNTEVVPLCAKVEAELAELEDAEAAELMQAYGLKESGRERFIRATYHLLGMISFFTCGEPECRAWTIRRGASALEAAGTVHTDFERGFIKAEVVSWNDLAATGSLAAAREAGKVKLEGKEYVVADGDAILFRHSS